jgi:hypothetical protein
VRPYTFVLAPDPAVVFIKIRLRPQLITVNLYFFRFASRLI